MRAQCSLFTFPFLFSIIPLWYGFLLFTVSYFDLGACAPCPLSYKSQCIFNKFLYVNFISIIISSSSPLHFFSFYRSWEHNGVASRATDRHSFTTLVSPQLIRRQARSDVATRELGLTRSHTVAELRTPKINLTGVTGERPRPQLSRASTWCAMPKVSSRSMSRFSSISTSSLPMISNHTDGRADALVSASCDGLVERVSALRSLANNPRLKVNLERKLQEHKA